MFNKIKTFLANCKENRTERRNKPWSKKQKFIFLLVLCGVLVYTVISMIISGNGKDFVPPSLDLSVNGLDMALLCLLGIGFLILKIRAYIKRRKGNGK